MSILRFTLTGTLITFAALTSSPSAEAYTPRPCDGLLRQEYRDCMVQYRTNRARGVVHSNKTVADRRAKAKCRTASNVQECLLQAQQSVAAKIASFKEKRAEIDRARNAALEARCSSSVNSQRCKNLFNRKADGVGRRSSRANRYGGAHRIPSTEVRGHALKHWCSALGSQAACIRRGRGLDR